MVKNQEQPTQDADLRVAMPDGRQVEGAADERATEGTMGMPAPLPDAGEMLEVTPQGEDVFFVRYRVDGREQAHNVRVSSLQQKVAQLQAAEQTAAGEEKERVEWLAKVSQWLLEQVAHAQRGGS